MDQQTKIAKVQDYIEKIKDRLADPNLEAAERKNKENQLFAQEDKLRRLNAGDEVDV